MAFIVGANDLLITCLEVIILAALLGFFTNLLNRLDLLFAMGIRGKVFFSKWALGSCCMKDYKTCGFNVGTEYTTS